MVVRIHEVLPVPRGPKRKILLGPSRGNFNNLLNMLYIFQVKMIIPVSRIAEK
jgi:hypothetical protein